MEDSKCASNENPRGSSKKGRKQDHSRGYVCGCGKYYLSYPALYTHIKTKHEGLQQEGTQKVIFLPNFTPKDFPQLPYQLLRAAEDSVPRGSVGLLQELRETDTPITSVDRRIIKSLVGKEIWEYFMRWGKNPPERLVLHRASSLDEVLIVYLLGIGQIVSFSLIKHYNIFARFFRSCFHHHAAELLSHYFKRNTREINVDECQMAPIISDFFIRYYMPYEVRDKEDLNLYELITHDFCSWMKEHQLTAVQITMTEKYELKNKSFFEVNLVNKKYERRKMSEKGENGESGVDKALQNLKSVDKSGKMVEEAEQMEEKEYSIPILQEQLPKYAAEVAIEKKSEK